MENQKQKQKQNTEKERKFSEKTTTVNNNVF
jgi:hypothetical protein